MEVANKSSEEEKDNWPAWVEVGVPITCIVVFIAVQAVLYITYQTPDEESYSIDQMTMGEYAHTPKSKMKEKSSLRQTSLEADYGAVASGSGLQLPQVNQACDVTPTRDKDPLFVSSSISG